MNKLIKSSFVLFLLIGFGLSLSANTASAVTYMPGCNANTIYSATTGKKCIPLTVKGVSTLSNEVEILDDEVLPTLPDTTPRIAYWWGKVNQHVDNEGNWLTDPDGTSGASIDKLAYCKKWYPNTIRVEAYKTETINTWSAARNRGIYSYAVVTDKCVQDSTSLEKPTITVISPNESSSFISGNDISLSWSSINAPSSAVVDLYYSSCSDGSCPSSLIKKGLSPTGKITWKANLDTGLYYINFDLRNNQGIGSYTLEQKKSVFI